MIVRSMPSVIPSGRSYVYDPALSEGGRIERYEINDYDYSDLFTYYLIREADFILLEWDIAISGLGLDKFIRKIERQPSQIHSVPYQVLSGKEAVWVNTDSEWKWIQYGQKWSAHFGFGCTYFPLNVYRHFRPPSMGDTRLTDTNFSRWHYEKFGPVRVHWDIPIIHLNI